MFIQDTEVLVAAFYNPTTTLQEYDTEQSDNKKGKDLKKMRRLFNCVIVSVEPVLAVPSSTTLPWLQTTATH